MKIGLFDDDIDLAAKHALLFKSKLPTCDIAYIESIEDKALSVCGLVIADPGNVPTKVWIRKFRALHGNVPLVLVSERGDLLSGSFGDACYAMSKPTEARDLLELVRYSVTGRVYGADRLDKRTN
jgi:hypothetical protein